MKVTNIIWATDGENAGLPEEVRVYEPIDEEDIADWLSDSYGWLVESFSVEYERIKKVELRMEEWTAHYPTGAIIHYYEGDPISDFCDSVEEYKRFLGEHKKELLMSKPEIIVSMDLLDIDISTVVDAAREIKEFVIGLEKEVQS